MKTQITPAELLHSIKSNVHNSEHYFTNGGCFQLYLMLKSIWHDAEAWYDAIDGHVYTKISGRYYDIKGIANDTDQLEKMCDMGAVYEKAFTWKVK